MPTYRAPDVYVEEISTFPPSVAEVGTAIPAFIGYTEKAMRTVAGDLTLKPTKIYSLREFEGYYGFPDADDINVDVTLDAGVPVAAMVKAADISKPEDEKASYLLYYAVKMFFDNGGAQCYVVSVGGYATTSAVEKDDLGKGLDAVVLEDEPTLLVVPEATQLDLAGYISVVGKMLKQCKDTRDRFAILDVWKGNWPKDTKIKVGTEEQDIIKASRGAWAGDLKYGAAYYPFVRTTMNPYVKADEANIKVQMGGATTRVTLGELNDPAKTTTYNTAAYNLVKAALKEQFLTMPPSAAVAGAYASTDAARGVWKAPANVALLGVLEPVVKLNNERQEDLNVDPVAGKSINAIRGFAGKGTFVWGARTLAGNDNEWRYVSVRRFFNMVEESIKKSTYWAVFEPNDANTWVKVRGMIENYLTDKWREGALAGATPRDAFFVKCGLGATMSAHDILEGRMNVEIGMAAVRPAEFIVLKFSHKLQTS
jgi:phage tail sheath protein FI